jgi:hypothetical protein
LTHGLILRAPCNALWDEPPSPQNRGPRRRVVPTNGMDRNCGYPGSLPLRLAVACTNGESGRAQAS